MSAHQTSRPIPFLFAWLPGLALIAAAACAGSGPAGPAAPPPTPVGIDVLQPKPVEISSEFVAVLRSRRSSQVRPQVEGIITRIFVKSGDRVSEGRPILQIDASKQQAALESDEASRQAQEEAVHYAQQQFDRSKQLLGVGAISQQDFEQAESALRTATASLEAFKARSQESRVQLQYYRVTAPTSGVVGDIPVRVGDRVKTDTVLTTVDQNAGLEVYIQVPIERAADIKPGLRVQLLDGEGGSLAETAIDFISPQVDDQTQSVLVKAPVPSGRGFRTEQFVRARVIWRRTPGLTIPAVSVIRINGQYFAFVAEPPQDGHGLVARQRSVKLGALIGNDYVVEDGLREGDRLIVSGVQKIGDGAPVQPQG
jgi:RND family efflux transporter MFP subunit